MIVESAGCSHQRPYARHFLTYRTVAISSIGIKFDSHRIWIEVVEVDLNVKCVLFRICLDCHFAEA